MLFLYKSTMVHKQAQSIHAVCSSWIGIDALGLVLATGQYVRSRLVVDGHRKTRSLPQMLYCRHSCLCYNNLHAYT